MVESTDEDVQLLSSGTSVIPQTALQYIRTEFDPLAVSNDMGMDLFCRLKEIIMSFLEQ